MLRFKKIDDLGSAHYADDDTTRYRIVKNTASPRHSWRLEVLRLVTTAGVRHATGQPILECMEFETRTLARAVANIYSELGDNYSPAEHGYRGRRTEAIIRAYA